MDPYIKDLIAAIAQIATMISLFVAIGVAIYQIRKYRQDRQSHLQNLQAQTFLLLTDRARQIRFSQGMDLIRSLDFTPGTDLQKYEDFKKHCSRQERNHIRNVVDFLNDIQHMMNHGYVSTQHILPIYTLSIMDCRAKLLDWWIEGFRHEQGGLPYYENFKTLCQKV
jgi:hypothetical protein